MAAETSQKIGYFDQVGLVDQPFERRVELKESLLKIRQASISLVDRYGIKIVKSLKEGIRKNPSFILPGKRIVQSVSGIIRLDEEEVWSALAISGGNLYIFRDQYPTFTILDRKGAAKTHPVLNPWIPRFTTLDSIETDLLEPVITLSSLQSDIAVLNALGETARRGDTSLNTEPPKVIL